MQFFQFTIISDYFSSTLELSSPCVYCLNLVLPFKMDLRINLTILMHSFKLYYHFRFFNLIKYYYPRHKVQIFAFNTFIVSSTGSFTPLDLTSFFLFETNLILVVSNNLRSSIKKIVSQTIEHVLAFLRITNSGITMITNKRRRAVSLEDTNAHLNIS